MDYNDWKKSLERIQWVAFMFAIAIFYFALYIYSKSSLFSFVLLIISILNYAIALKTLPRKNRFDEEVDNYLKSKIMVEPKILKKRK